MIVPSKAVLFNLNSTMLDLIITRDGDVDDKGSSKGSSNNINRELPVTDYKWRLLSFDEHFLNI